MKSASQVRVESARDIAERITARAIQLKEAASAKDIDLVNSLVERAKAVQHPVDRIMERVVVTPTIAALLWLDHNGYNRDWDAIVTFQYSSLMSAGHWKITSQSVYALYGRTGEIADASHRLAAQVLSDTTHDVYFCLGMSKDDVAALDCGKRRQPHDTAKLLGVAKAKDKGTLIHEMWTYLRKAAVDTDDIPDADVNGRALKIKEYDHLLTRAMEIGAATSVGAEDPLFKDITTARIAAICLACGWDEERIIQYLSEFQTEEFSSENSPLFHAHERIKEHIQPADVWRVPQQVAIVIKAMLMEVSGVEISSARHKNRMRELTGATKNGNWPDPRLPDAEPDTEAAND